MAVFDAGVQPSGPVYQQPQAVPPPQTVAPADATPTPADTPAQPASGASTGGGGGGFWGWVDHAAKAVSHAVGSVANKIPGVSTVTGALNRVYTDVVSHPVATFLHMANVADYQHQGPGFFFKGSNWQQAWQASTHISPGQEVALGFNNGGVGFGPILGAHPVDPNSSADVLHLLQSNSFASVVSGSLDLGLRAYLDPTSVAAKALGNEVAFVKNAPVRATTDIEGRVQSARGQALTKQVASAFDKAKPFNTIANLKAVRASENSYGLATALYATKGDAVKIDEVKRLAMGDGSALDRISSDIGNLTKLQEAAQVPEEAGKLPMAPLHATPDFVLNNPELKASPGKLAALRISNWLSPADLTMKSGLTDMDHATLMSWLKDPSKLKTEHAQQMINEKLDELNSYLTSAGTMQARTTGNLLGTAGANLRTDLQLASRPLSTFRGDVRSHPTTFLQQVVGHAGDPVVRLYHTLTDVRPTRFMDFGDPVNAVPQMRALLNTFPVVDPIEKDGMLADFAAAAQRGRTATQKSFESIEKQLHEKTFEYFGASPEMGSEAYRQFSSRRAIATTDVVSRAYGAMKDADGRDGGAVFPTTDYTHVVTDPYLETQLARGAVPMADGRDLTTALRRMQETGLLQHYHSLADKGHGLAVDALSRFYGMWKPVTMLTGHRVYNHVGDDAARTMVKIGAMGTLSNMAKGASDLLRNATRPLTKNLVLHNLHGQWEKELQDLNISHEALRARYLDQQQRMAQGETIFPANRIQPADLQAAKAAVEAKKAAEPTYVPKARLGERTLKVPGTNITYHEIFGGADGPYLRQLLGADKTMTELFDKTGQADFNSLSMAADHDVIGPAEGVKIHGNALLRYINNQLTNDPVAKMMAEGKTDEQIADWMSGSAAGRARMKAMHIGYPMDNIEMVRDAMNRYLPTQWSRDRAFGQKLTADDLQRIWPAAASRPAVSGNMALLTHAGGPHAGYIRRAASKIVHLTGTMPDDILVRHPLANELYKTSITRRIKQQLAQGREVHIGTPAYDVLHKQAIQETRSIMQKTLYDTSRFSDAGQTLRFVIPFFNAWHNAMTSWSGLIASNPQLVARGLEAKHALWNAPFAIDRSTGQPANDKTSMENLTFLMHMPPSLAKKLGMGDVSDIPISAQTVISPTYADSVTSPGFGPLVQVPANQMVKEDPHLLNNPYVMQILGGRVTANSFASMIPSAVSEVTGLAPIGDALGAQQDSIQLAKMKWTLYQEQYYDYQNGKRAQPPNWNDISSQAMWLTGISGLVNRLMPLGFKPQDRYKFLTDAYQQMYAQDPAHADENFYDKYGTAGFVYTQSLGKDTGGVAPTVGAIQRYQQYLPLIKKYPELASVIVGPDGGNQFDYKAYSWEVANGLRTQITPQAAADAVQQNLGWVMFNKVNAAINAELTNRGLNSINQRGAEDLRTFKDDYIKSTGDPSSQYYNPKFYDAFGSFNANQYETRIQALAKIAQDPGLQANPLRSDIKSLNTWVTVRQATYQELQSRTHKTLTASSNSDLSDWYDQWTGYLEQSDTKFSALFQRYLSKDDFKESLL